MKNYYDDIINLPHHVSKTRPRMSRYDRAAQFAPFKALVGLDDQVAEAARVTAEQSEISDDEFLEEYNSDNYNFYDK